MKNAVLFFFILILSPALPAFAQQQVTGRVTDEQGPLQGVSVIVKHTATGVQTDANGRFAIRANRGDTLSFSYSGYASQEAVVNENTVYNVSMTTDARSLEGVVVVGYGTRRKQFLTGAVSSVGAEVFQARPIANAYAALQGQVPGVVIQRFSGQPGNEGFELNVRGYASANGSNSPLVLIDGVAGNLDLLNPDDIESISVLKDAAASIYGARAAGGVFIVTTKKGKRGEPRITYGNNFATSKLAGMMKSPTHYEMAIMDNEANIHNGATPMYTPQMLEKIRNNDPNPIPHPIYGGWMLFFTNTDWLKETFENGFQQKHNLNVSGGGNNSTYYLSGSFSDQHGVIRYAEDNNKRYNLRLNYDYDISKWLRLESKVSFEHQKRTDIGGLGNWVITEAIFGMPNHPVYTPDGKFFAQGGWGNAVAQAKEAETATFDKRNINTNFRLVADLLPGLKFNFQTGVNFRTEKWDDRAKPVPLYNWDGTIAYYTIANPGESKLTLTNVETIYKNFTGYFEYNKQFGGKHEIGIMAGGSHEENDYEWFNASRQNLVTDDVWSLNLGTQNFQSDGRGEDWAIRSLFSRLNYMYNNRYIFEANMRYDGSSRFHPDKRWGLFPGVSAAWRIWLLSFRRRRAGAVCNTGRHGLS
jgi:TonB-linked SusC/RagA family outer membrane protein